MLEVSKPSAPIEVFFSYSHKDEELRDELSKHLAMLKRRHVITGWHDRRIGAGKEWQSEIDHHLKTADIVLLLVSSDFLASEHCYDVEVRRAMERHDTQEARVIPVILRPVDWKGAPFVRLQALPKDAKPITAWANRDDAFLNVAEGIRAAVEELTIGKIGYLLEKFESAQSLGNWPNVVDLGERILKALPDHESILRKTAAAYVKRWASRLGEKMDDLACIEIRKKRNEDFEKFEQILVKMAGDLNRAIQLHPENAEYYFIRASVIRFASFNGYKLSYKYWQEEADLTRAIELDPRSAKYYYARGVRLGVHSEDKQAALRDLQRAFELGYPEVNIRLNRGRIYYDDMKDYEAALKEYQRAAELGGPVGRLWVSKITGIRTGKGTP